MFAARLADVLIRDPYPAELVRVGDHPLDHRPALLLGVGAAGHLGPGVSEAVGKPVANSLELANPEHPRPPCGANGPLDPLARKGRGEQLPKLALEPCDLPAQLVARGLGAGRPHPAIGRHPAWAGSGPRGADGLGIKFEKLGHAPVPFQSRTQQL